MREIKFKAWCEVPGTDNRFFHFFSVGQIVPVKLSVVVWCQYTGFKDKNGKEIYEGDVLQMFWNKKKDETCGDPFVVSWNETQARFTDWSPRENVEIVGNVYENPELLGGDDGKLPC